MTESADRVKPAASGENQRLNRPSQTGRHPAQSRPPDHPGLRLRGLRPVRHGPVSTPREAWSGHGTMHQLLGALVFSLMPVRWRRREAIP